MHQHQLAPTERLEEHCSITEEDTQQDPRPGRVQQSARRLPHIKMRHEERDDRDGQQDSDYSPEREFFQIRPFAKLCEENIEQ